jgi:hypothetical protein|nr:MAG TPA: Type I restriction enzyme Methylase [Caudoviricetes sp.]
MLKKIWEIIEDIAGRNDKEKEQDAIKVQQNVEDFISNAKANFNDNYSKIINSKENMSNSITSNNFNEKNNIWNQIQENAERSIGIVKNNIGNFGNDTGRTVENTWLGATSGTKQSLKYLTKFGENINGGARYYKDGNEIKLTDLPNYLTEEQLKKLKNINEEVKDKLGFNMDKKLQSSINKDQEKIQKNIENQGNSVSKKLAELAPSIGNMIPGMVASSLNPVLGATYFTASSGGSYIDDAKERGMTDEQAFSYGTMMGIMEGITEGVTVGNFKKAGTAINSIIKETGKEAAKKGTEQLAKTSIKQVLKDYGIGIADNAIQEAIMEPIQETVAGAIGGKEKSDWHNMGQRMLQSGINGGLVGAIVGGGNMGIQSCAAVVEKINNGKTPSNTEIKLAIKDASKELDVEKMIQDSVIQQTNKYKNYHTETVVDNINTNISNQTQNVISNNQNMQQNAIQNQSKTQGQQIISTQNQNIQKSDIVENNNTKIAKMKNFDESAKQYNIDYKNEDLKEIKQMFDRRGINAYFDENTFKNNDDAFSVWKPIYDEQGNVADREVVFNPKTQDTNTRVQELAIHELGHDLDLNEVQNMILKDASKKENWENARKSLENTYKQAYENDNIQISDENFNKIVDEEATMSILQRELGNQEYVNRLVNQNKSVAKKIYNWVIDKLNKFTGGKNEKIFWTDIRNKFETAYNQEFSKYDSNLKYSVAGKEALKNIKEPKLSQEAYNSYNKAKQMAKNKESNEKIYKETGWYKDKVTGKMKFNFSDKDMKIANQNYKVGQEFKLKDILIHNTLFEMYPQLRDYKVKIEDMNSNNTKNNGRLNGRYNRFTDELTIDINRFNDISNAEGTLIHEIQHAIQKIEGFAGGTSIKFGKEKYKNNPGEIEARDTSKRMIEEKYNGKDLSNIMPKSANVNTSILEKMKIGLYNYLSNISNEEVSNEFTESNKNKNSSNTSENNGLVLGGIKDWQQFVEDNYKKQGTGNSLKEYNLPTKENTKTDDIKPYRASAQIANDSKISDLDAIKEETKKVNIATIDEGEKLQNELRENSVENSPTIDYIKAKRSKEKVGIKEIKDTLAQKFVNKGHYIDKLAEKKGNKNLTYLYDRTMNTFNESQISIGDNQINSKGEVVGKSIIDIFQPAQDMNVSKEFEDYLLNKHNISRYAHEKGIFGKEISATYSQNIVNSYEKKYPQFKEWAKDVSKYNDNNIKDLVSNGLVSETTYKNLKKMYGDYVPTFRDITDNISQYEDDRVGGNVLKKATESNLDILSVKESMAEQTMAIKKAIRINNLGIELYKTLGKDSTITSGIDFDAVAMQTIAGNVIDSEGKGKNTFTIFKDGEMTQFKISDELYSAFSKDTLQNKINNSKVAKAILTPIEKMSKAQRELLTTYSVGFAMNNPIKDFQDALFNSKYNGATFVKNWTKALYNIATDGSWYQSYKNNGGTANTYFDYNKGILPAKTKNPVKKFVNKIKDVNEVLEQAPRLAEYISTIEHKGSIDEALYNAADITTNFKRGGDITKAINKYGANFLNASVQGLDKVYRNVSGKNGWKGYANLILKATAYQITPAIINGLLLGDDDDYEDLPDYTKDNYFLFKLGDGKFFRIPKGRVSSVIGGVARRTLETIEGKEVDWKSLVDTTINQLAPNNPITDNIIAPIKQTIDNKSWFGGDIVNTRLQNLPVAEQYDESTDELSKFLGKNLKISPKKINYVLDQYSGGIGDMILPMMTPQAENNILEDKFTTDSVMKNKNVSEYYSKTEELEKTKNSLNATDEDKIKYKYFTNESTEMSDLYKQKREIQNSNISDKDKKEKVRNIQKKINDIVENKLSNFEKLDKNDRYATIDNSQYYKDIKGDWNELSDEEKEKNKNSNISLKSYSDFKYQTGKLKQEKGDKGELKDNEQLKDKDKIQILVDSNYSKDEKESIYKNYINSKDKKTILVDKLGLPINQYLKYKTQTFENDKDTDGETISGSKKQKVYNYLNSISDEELSQDYKKIICKIEDINTYDNDIVNFVNSSKNLNYSERTEILKNIGFKIDKSGKIQTKSMIPIYKYVK